MQALYSANIFAEARKTSPSQQTSDSNAPPLPPLYANMQSQPHFAALPMNGATMQQPPPLPTYNPNHGHFQYPNGVMQPVPMPSNGGMPGQNGMMRFPLPPPPAQMMGDRHKNKEGRRRTKTGCLTCRKRRIKCDEGHPICRNCQKSKRECLGYDPIFKQQTGPAPIQPAPANSSPSKTKATTSTTQITYQPQHQTYPGTGGTFVPAANQSQNRDAGLEYSTSLDPALAGTEQALTMAASSVSTTLHATRKVKPITMDQLFSLDDVPPRYQVREPQPASMNISQQEVDDFYRFHFAQGLDKLFETTWYSSRGFTLIQQDPTLLDFVCQCIDQFKTPDASLAQMIQSLEARLVWQLAIMPRASSLTNNANGITTDQLTSDLLPRIDIIEFLLTGQHLPQERVPLPPTEAMRSDAIKYNEQNFWHQLGSFTSLRDDYTDPQTTQAINDTLNAMRGILGIMESRDVLYSLAIARYIGGRMEQFHPRQPLVASGDPNDEVSKLEVARRHIDIEDQKGTTQVIQRICGMAIRSWILQKQ